MGGRSRGCSAGAESGGSIAANAKTTQDEKASDELPIALTSHALPGRTRIKVTDKRHDAAYFTRLRESFCALRGIQAVEANPLTASLLLIHTVDIDTISDFARSKSLFEITSAEPSEAQPPTQQGFGNFERLNREIRSRTGGATDFWGLTFLLMFGLGVSELIKGNIASPATTMFWYALSALLIAQRKEGVPL